MKSRATPRFWSAFADLSPEIKQAARAAYAIFEKNPGHPSLRFKRVHAKEPIYSARITRDFRALGLMEGSEIVWFWIGSHAEYDRLLERL